jgi:hypothetical protein
VRATGVASRAVRYRDGVSLLSRTILGLCVLLGAAAVWAAPAGAAPEGPVSVKILGGGDIIDDGAGAEVRVQVRCDPEPPLLEALVTASQEGTVGFGQGFFVGGVECDGRQHVLTARITTFDPELFVRGKAFVSAFVLLCDPVTGECFDGQDTRFVQLR